MEVGKNRQTFETDKGDVLLWDDGAVVLAYMEDPSGKVNFTVSLDCDWCKISIGGCEFSFDADRIDEISNMLNLIRKQVAASNTLQ